LGISPTASPTALLAYGDLWHRRLGHPSSLALSSLPLQFLSPCNNARTSSPSFCDACQLGKQTRLPFALSHSRATAPFDLIHCDLWTSPITSFSGYKYYLVALDDFSHFSWTFPLRAKSDTSDTLIRFFTFIHTHFHTTVRCLQSNNGGEFLNNTLRTYLSSHGISLRLSCPYTSAQNGRAERLIRTTNDITCTLLFQANLPPPFWVGALYTATHLLNIRPSRAISNATPYFRLYGIHATYDHLRTFGCLCFPNAYSTSPHKLAPRATRCVFIGYPQEHKGYRCLDLQTRKVIVSRHVVFNEAQFPCNLPTPLATDPPAAADPSSPDQISLGTRAQSLRHHFASWPAPTAPAANPSPPPQPDPPTCPTPPTTSPSVATPPTTSLSDPAPDSPDAPLPSTPRPHHISLVLRTHTPLSIPTESCAGLLFHSRFAMSA
jgi:histone deacetylase 1/2